MKKFLIIAVAAVMVVSMAPRAHSIGAFLSYWNGEDIDPKSNLNHLWKAMACLAVVVDAQQCEKLNDDRPPSVDIDAMLEGLESVVAELRERYG